MINLNELEAKAKASLQVAMHLWKDDEIVFHEACTPDTVLKLIKVCRAARQLSNCACQETLDELDKSLEGIE